jgi:phospholipid/cholesterol/gamma-HCH transport system ATP-binding protein
VSPAIELQHVSKAFGGRTVLEDVSFQVRSGEGFCILGRSGTGKSVTLKHIVGLVKPDAGHVCIEGTDITTLGSGPLNEVRRRMGFVFQNGALFDSITVGENVAFVLRRHTQMSDKEVRTVARDKLASVGLEADYEKMPADLSGGMRKRAGLARALALDPPILLVDEPSAGLDPITSAEIDDLLLALKTTNRTTLVIVTHNMPSAKKLADRFLMLERGRIAATGSLSEMERAADPVVQAFIHSTHAG